MVDSYMATFENAEVEKAIDFDLLDKYQAEWLKANGAVAQDYIDQFFLAGADPVAERDYLYAMQKLNEDGYFDGGMPRYTGMISGLSDREIDKAKAFISGSEEKHSELAGD
ncbi:MAG: hypothetical protein IPL72_07440 [Sulfuritalea sp.]|nr:hypothetical protein [Sulfuritalea sp.]